MAEDPAKPITAQHEIMIRIKNLDREENDWLARADRLKADAENLRLEAKRAEERAEVLARMRRQYEYALQQLGGELPPLPENPPKIPVKRGGTVIGVLG